MFELNFTIVIDATSGSDKPCNKTDQPENHTYPGTAIFGMGVAHSHEQQSQRPPQNTAKPYGDPVLSGIVFFRDHIR